MTDTEIKQIALLEPATRQGILSQLSEADLAEIQSYIDCTMPGRLESALAWLGKDRFGIGTEGGCKDGAEHVLIVTRAGNEAKVTRDIAIPLRAWGATCDEKRGIEGLCAAGGKMVAAFENPLAGKNGERYAAPVRRSVA